MARIGIENVGVLNSVTGKISGGKGSFLISEDLLAQVQFIHSGSFVESGGQPTLKLVGEVAPIKSQLVQPTKLVRSPLNGPDIIWAFLRRESVLSPMDYIRQICFESSAFYPVHFFINQTSVRMVDVIADLGKTECRPKVKDKLTERLKAEEKFACGKLKTESEKGKVLRRIFEGLVTKSLTNKEAETDLVGVFHAITHLTRDNGDPEFILPLLQRVAMPKYSALSSPDGGFMRKAICHLDVIWYKQSSGKGSQLAAAKAS